MCGGPPHTAATLLAQLEEAAGSRQQEAVVLALGAYLEVLQVVDSAPSQHGDEVYCFISSHPGLLVRGTMPAARYL